MENRFEVTREMIEKAKTYIPISMKEFIAADVARLCTKQTKMIHSHLDTDEADDIYNMSPVYCENVSTKSRILMTILMVFYLGVWSDESPMLCTIDDYDEMAGAHVMNQIERFKTTPDLREKVFDLIGDYKEMEKYMNSAIYSVLREMNDPVTRYMKALGEIGSSEGLAKVLEEIQKSQDGIIQERERQERIIRGEEGDEGDG